MSKLTHGVVTSLEPLVIRADRRDYTLDAVVPGLLAGAIIGSVVRFTITGRRAIAVKLTSAVPRGVLVTFPLRLDGIVTSYGLDEGFVVHSIPAMHAFRHLGRVSADGTPLQIGDRVRFDVVTDDGRAWDLSIGDVADLAPRAVEDRRHP